MSPAHRIICVEICVNLEGYRFYDVAVLVGGGGESVLGKAESE